MNVCRRSVKAARDLCSLARALPCHFPAVHRLRGNNFVGALLSVVSGKTVFLMRKNVVFWLGPRENAAPMTQSGHSTGIKRNDAPRTCLCLGFAYSKCWREKVHLPPCEAANLTCTHPSLQSQHDNRVKAAASAP